MQISRLLTGQLAEVRAIRTEVDDPEPAWLSDFVAGMQSANLSDRYAAHTRLLARYDGPPAGRERVGGGHGRLQRQILAAVARETGPGGRLHDVAEAHMTYAALLLREQRFEEFRREVEIAFRLAGGRDPWERLFDGATSGGPRPAVPTP